MGVRHSKEGKGAVASTTDFAILAATSVVVASNNPLRQKVELWVSGATQVVVGYSAVATSTFGMPLASQALPYLDSTFTGPISVAIPSAAASSSIRVREIAS